MANFGNDLHTLASLILIAFAVYTKDRKNKSTLKNFHNHDLNRQCEHIPMHSFAI
jgi:hypothetical protein